MNEWRSLFACPVEGLVKGAGKKQQGRTKNLTSEKKKKLIGGCGELSRRKETH